MKTKLILTGFALIAFVAMAVAQEQPAKTQAAQTTSGTFVDANNDGVCDNFTQNRQGQGQGKGLNQNNKANIRQGQGYRKGNGKCNGQGQGKAQGLRNGKGNQANFVDENKNGVCDRRE
ncbi:MAG: hypothetical protein CVU09_03160 [Bacteroidetes bacterium HGW-Bacteroidetes-4]|jgi:hypothetical protein|nr:MAG: hypothetical protein CVU09_03160 [Bacteroidetes bacterium HGW-Bacteroidetes-4]